MTSVIVWVALATGGGQQTHDLPKNDCASRLRPLDTIRPALPGRTESQFAGSIYVVIVIERNGGVSFADISRVDVKQVDRREFSDSGYAEAVIDAVGKWTFPEVSMRCKKEVEVKLALSR
ncbi:hypothetical protein J7373_08490 [Xanthomonas sp. A2111]|uniref:TonB C-terminal domain-containing protein n=1 Tax=Xanthomonas hawaiiensis TaxID=3003247 RepID=A0ABU2I5K5_9XANT|nr:hypothetical protein [Xanthomonas sp. A2111]MBO9828279.1 hypothetical protein [Xanthomonas sp. A2111]MDS9993027.1 hypothetical protein [Xanthomonas sp. A2111]